ncbi:MAG: hypothetical protein JNK82_43315 [Myxococcaceae bacterium]|nr:hypothetical protein [Myxococcaceae bacterium]
MWRLLLLLCACVKAVTPPAPEPAPRSAATDPCAADLSGDWLLEEELGWRYSARDDGGTLDVVVTRFADAGSSATMQLTRGDAGFSGVVRGLGGLPSGVTCELTFPIRVTQCSGASLTLLAAADGVIGEGCATPARPRKPAMLEHKLTRADAGGMRFSQ